VQVQRIGIDPCPDLYAYLRAGRLEAAAHAGKAGLRFAVLRIVQNYALVSGEREPELSLHFGKAAITHVRLGIAWIFENVRVQRSKFAGAGRLRKRVGDERHANRHYASDEIGKTTAHLPPKRPNGTERLISCVTIFSQRSSLR